MHPFDKKIAGEMVITGDKRSNTPSNGSISTAGGVGIKKNLNVEEDIVAGELTIKKNTTLNFLKVNKIQYDSLWKLNNNNVHFKKNIIPDNNQTLGDDINRWRTIYSGGLDTQVLKTKHSINNNVLIDGELIIKKNQLPIIKMNNKNLIINNIKNQNIFNLDIENEHLNIKTELFSVNGILNIDKKSRRVITRGVFDTNIISINNFLQIQPQNITIDKQHQTINLKSSVLMIDILKRGILKINTNDFCENSIIRIIIRESSIKPQEEMLRIEILDNTFVFSEKAESIQFIINNNKLFNL
ncbi:MAG: hypothetical protein CMF62_01630 [Magnetococcales bacterium]|nr:hypothetical protein [Magnetococcales bacterium]|tara:strand:+ start:57630 stop:58526 length:897 start_codon:yes stop_codon:yes gene_type:complete